MSRILIHWMFSAPLLSVYKKKTCPQTFHSKVCTLCCRFVFSESSGRICRRTIVGVAVSQYSVFDDKNGVFYIVWVIVKRNTCCVEGFVVSCKFFAKDGLGFVFSFNEFDWNAKLNKSKKNICIWSYFEPIFHLMVGDVPRVLQWIVNFSPSTTAMFSENFLK